MTLLPDLQRWLDDAAKRHGVPGAAVAVGAGGDLAEAATGVVNAETGVEATPDSVFQIGSVTKIWTASLVMQLVDDGLVGLDEPVRRYVPEFGVLDPVASETVTVRQLLSHTGGFDGDLFEDTGRGDDASARLLAFMRSHAGQVHPPGAMFSYANSGFCVLGALVARLRGGTWESVVREWLAEPLGVTHLALFSEEALRFRAAVGHVGGGEGEPRVYETVVMPRSNAPAGSTLTAAPRELIRLGRMFLADGVAGDGTRVLPAGTFAAMCARQVTPPRLSDRHPSGWGLGFMLFDWDGTPVVGHDGSTPGQSTAWRIVPGRDVVVAVNANGGAATALIDDLLTAVLAEVAGIRVPTRSVPPAEPAPFTADGMAGRFSGPVFTYDVSVTDGGLDVSTTPKGFMADMGEEPKTERYVSLGGDRFVGIEPEGGAHPLLMFLDGGRYLYGGRAVPRVDE